MPFETDDRVKWIDRWIFTLVPLVAYTKMDQYKELF